MDENDLLPHEPFEIGDWVVDPDSGRLRRGDDEVKLEPKVMAVLVCLAQQPGKVFSREELESTVWAGTVVGYDALSNSVIKLRKALGDDRRNPRYIETVSKKGYRLVAEVRPHRLDTGITEAGTSPVNEVHVGSPDTGSQRPRFVTLAIGVLVAVGVGVSLVIGLDPFGLRQADDDTASKPAIVVLPFKNLSDDPQQEYFSDGITDDLITDLSRVGGLRVVARQSSYFYKNQDVQIDKVAKDLGVQYILAGSVRKHGKNIRINVQLTNASTGGTAWAERYDRTSENFFGMQDAITGKIVGAMLTRVPDRQAAREPVRATRNFAAYDKFLLGQQYTARRNQQGYERAVEAYEQAIALDPNYARAYGALAVSVSFAYRLGWTDLSTSEARARAMELAKKAYELDPGSPQVNWSLGFVHLFRQEYAQAETAAKRSVELSPSYADGYGLLAFVSNLRGEPADAVRYIKKAITLNPYHTFDYPWNLGLAYYNLGRYEEAATALEDAINRNDNALWVRLYLAASYVRLGRMDDAKWEIDNVYFKYPDTTLKNFSVGLPLENKDQMQAVLTDLRKAGLHEG
jgi:adenylate cyclase